MLQAYYPRRDYSFCDCIDDEKYGKECDCPYEVEGKEIECPSPAWGWSTIHKTASTDVAPDGQTVYFHSGYSNGNACVRGDTPFIANNHYFWEIKVLKPVYGSSVMIGVGTGNVVVNKFASQFCHMLGDDGESWGLTFRGMLQHKKISMYYHPRAGFSIGSIIGVHLDMWNGTLEFFMNREPLGIAFSGLRHLELYPMITSTAAHSSMRLTYSIIRPHSLSFLALTQLPLTHFQKLPYGLGGKLSECWWHFPRPSSKSSSKNLERPEPHCGIYVLIDSDEEDSESNQVLALRMKRVVENSRGAGSVLALRPLPKKMRKDQVPVRNQ